MLFSTTIVANGLLQTLLHILKYPIHTFCILHFCGIRLYVCPLVYFVYLLLPFSPNPMLLREDPTSSRGGVLCLTSILKPISSSFYELKNCITKNCGLVEEVQFFLLLLPHYTHSTGSKKPVQKLSVSESEYLRIPVSQSFHVVSVSQCPSPEF